jgi:hypothetical protein
MITRLRFGVRAASEARRRFPMSISAVHKSLLKSGVTATAIQDGKHFFTLLFWMDD